MDHGALHDEIKEIDAPDVLLWATWAIQQYSVWSTEACREKYLPLLVKIINYILQSKHPNLFLHPNGLLYTEGTEKAVSWMNAMENGRPVTPRTGYLVEFNALWFNALHFAANLVKGTDYEHYAELYLDMAKMTGQAFRDVFINPYGYLYDYVAPGFSDPSVRPNMLGAVALEYSPLTKAERKGVLDIITRELVTPKGIRTLSPKSEGYNPYYVGNQAQRNYAYHQGTAWPWLTGAYAEAYMRVFGRSGLSYIERKLIGFEEEMSSHCIGTLSEVYDGNPPFTGRGAISIAMNVGEVLRVLKMLEIYNTRF
jgi:predicted glycogen debranching enzyme